MRGLTVVLSIDAIEFYRRLKGLGFKEAVRELSARYGVANPALQADLAEFADMWANNIGTHGWLEHSQRYQPRKLQAPDLETLIEWMVDDGGCEATNGCWVEPDGICPHGCQSWFLVMGLI